MSTTTPTIKPFEITEDDIGVEGKYQYYGRPATLVAILERVPADYTNAVFKTTTNPDPISVDIVVHTRLDGSDLAFDANGPGQRRQLITKAPQKAYVAVKLSGKITADDIGQRIPEVLRSYVWPTREQALEGVNSWPLSGYTHVFEIEV